MKLRSYHLSRRRDHGTTYNPNTTSYLMNKIIEWIVSKQLKPVLKSWKTTLLGLSILLPNAHDILTNFGGILQVLIGVADGGTVDVDKLKTLAIALGAGVALLFSRDANKSTEDSVLK
jgi:hypothetical protein